MSQFLLQQDTLSNLSFDNQLEVDLSDADELAVTAPLAPPPVPAPRNSVNSQPRNSIPAVSSNCTGLTSHDITVCVTQPEENMMAEISLPPGAEYKPPSGKSGLSCFIDLLLPLVSQLVIYSY